MRPRTLAERAAFISAVIGPVIGALFLFAPIQGYCMQSASVIATPIPPGATPGPRVFAPPGPTICGTEALWQHQPIFPLPFFAVLIWSLGPVIAYIGVRMRVRGDRGLGSALMAAGVFVAFTSIISFGAGPYFLPFVFLPTLLTTMFAFARS
jgi:hypothetical protein